LRSIPLTPANLAGYDCIVVATDHKAFDYKAIQRHAKLIVDARGVYTERAENVVGA
jgi:UDP-N-acetyl-D-glucosamine dehydrogenase